MNNLQERIEQLRGEYQDLKNNKTTGNCWRLSTTMQEIEAGLREHVQGLTKDTITAIISKLETGQNLTPDDIQAIKLWICGDASYYVQLENNYQDWLEELDRTVQEVDALANNQPDFDIASRMRATLLDSIRVLGDIMFYLKQKERIENFDDSTQEIDPQERELLNMLLKGQLRYPNE
jgi:hypothetical protein